MQRALLCSILSAAACGSDDDTADDAAGSDESTTGSPTSTADTTITTTVTTTQTTEVDTSTSTDTSTGEPETTGSTGVDTSSDDGSTTGGGGIEACLPAEVFAALDQHAHDLDATAGLLATHPSQNEVTGFLLAPGLPFPPALAAAFAGPLVMTCSEPLLYDPFCEKDRCSQIECTGSGAGWINHLWIPEQFVAGEWTFDDVHVHLRWNDGATGTFIDIATTATGPDGIDLSLTGEGLMDVDELSVTETFAALHPAGVTTMDYVSDDVGHSGQLTIAGVVVAEVDAAGHFVPTGDCP